ncbi:MAG: pilus assembly protein PilM [Verrucomicrobiota bacterium]
MAKAPSSAIGIDVGRHSIKAVLLQRRSAGRLALTHFAVREVPEEANTLEALGENLKPLLHDLGATAKAVGIAVSHPDAMVRIIEQNTIPPELLRDALRINGPMLLSQDCREWVIDCQVILPSGAASAPKDGEQARYLVGGWPRVHVQKIHEACGKNKLPSNVLQLPAVALLNAFEFANADVFKKEAFVLVDIGHRSSTVIVGVKGELILVRGLDYGGAHFVEHLILQGAASFEEAVAMMEQEEVLTVENARLSLNELVRSISSSIGFFEAQREETIPRIFVSGGLSRLPALRSILVEELNLPCETWDPFADCELGIPRARVASLTAQLPLLGVAFGVAAEIVKGGA